MQNHAIIMKGFQILRDVLAPYIGRELSLEYGSNVWWRDGVLKELYGNQKQKLPVTGDFATVTDAMDIALCLLLLADIHWHDIFRAKLSVDHRTWAKELVGYRNRTAHIGGKDFDINDTWRALDTMARLSEQIDPECAEKIRGLLRASNFTYANVSTTINKTTSSTDATTDNTGGFVHAVKSKNVNLLKEIDINVIKRTLGHKRVRTGLDKYLKIQDLLHRCNVERDSDFQRTFNGFYRIRQRPAEFYQSFYHYMEENKCSSVTFEDVLSYIFSKTGRIESSFSSKLLATICEDMPVWDSVVLSQLGIKQPQDYYKTPSVRLTNRVNIYNKLVAWYESYLTMQNAGDVIGVFDNLYPDVKVSAVKKIDLALWSLALQ